MEVTLESLRELIDKSDMTVADIEFIVYYLLKENISPQLAMRRIKTIEILKKKLDNNTDQEMIQELREQLEETEKTLQDKLQERESALTAKLDEQQNDLTALITEKTSLEKQKQELENKSDLFDSERDALRIQLKMMQEMQAEEEDEGGPIGREEQLNKSISQLCHDIKQIIMDKDELTSVLLPIHDTLSVILSEPDSYTFDTKEYLDGVKEYSDISPIEKEPAIKPTKVTKETAPDKEVVKEEEKPKKPVKIKPEKTEEEKVDKQTLQILNLFLDFVDEATTDKGFQDRISTISEMDEAYEHLGSIALSQLYSFVSKGIDKKEELVKLLKQWKMEGVPR